MHLPLLHILLAMTMYGIEFLFISRESVNQFVSITGNLRFRLTRTASLLWIQRLRYIEKTFNSFFYSHTGARMNHHRKQFGIYYNTLKKNNINFSLKK